MIEAQLADMVDAGTLRRGEAGRIFYPTWNRTPDEWRDQVDETGFDLLAGELSATDDAQTYDVAARSDGESFATRYLPFVRAITENPFFRRLDTDRSDAERAAVIEAFYQGLRGRIAADPLAAACRWHVMTLRLRRRDGT